MKDARRVNAARIACREEWLFLPRSQSEARDKGVELYFTGKKCAAGHAVRRLTETGKCTTCWAAPPLAVLHHRIAFERAARRTIETGVLHYVRRSLVLMATGKVVVAQPEEIERWFKAAGEQSLEGPWMVPVFDQKGVGRVAKLVR